MSATAPSYTIIKDENCLDLNTLKREKRHAFSSVSHNPCLQAFVNPRLAGTSASRLQYLLLSLLGSLTSHLPSLAPNHTTSDLSQVSFLRCFKLIVDFFFFWYQALNPGVLSEPHPQPFFLLSSSFLISSVPELEEEKPEVTQAGKTSPFKEEIVVFKIPQRDEGK